MGERLAKGYLRREGYKVLYRNFRAPAWRRSGSGVQGSDMRHAWLSWRSKRARLRSKGWLTERRARPSLLTKQKLIAKGALEWLRLLDQPDIVFRFDIVEIVIEEGEPRFNLIKDAFKLPEPYIY